RRRSDLAPITGVITFDSSSSSRRMRRGGLVVLTGSADSGSARRSVVIEPDGSYSSPGLRPGTYTAELLVPRGRRPRLRRAGLAGDVVLPPGVSRVVNFTLVGGDRGSKSMFLVSFGEGTGTPRRR